MAQDGTIKYLFLIAACGFALHASAFADSINLKPAVRLIGETKAITLGDIADLQGPEAEKFATLSVLKIVDSSAVVEISIKEVRSALDQAGVNWGAVNLSGRTVIVRPSRDGSANPPVAMSGMSLTKTPLPPTRTAGAPHAQPRTAEAIASLSTVRGVVASRIAAGLHVNPQNFRLTFDDADAAFLDAEAGAARIEIEPQSSFNSDRIALTVRLWNDDRVQQQHTVGIQPLVLVKAATLLKDVDKDQTIAEDDLTVTEQWLPPSQVPLTISYVQAIGQAAGKKLNAGEVLRDKSIRRDALVKRGQQVTVRCLVGGVAISMQAEARADGSEGDTIELRKQGERDTFRATVTNRGEAVIDLRQKDSHSPSAT